MFVWLNYIKKNLPSGGGADGSKDIGCPWLYFRWRIGTCEWIFEQSRQRIPGWGGALGLYFKTWQ